MQVFLATLLYVGVQLLQFSGAKGPLPPPHIQAVPCSLILSGKPVTIQCAGPPGAEHYLISKKEVSEVGEKTQLMNNRTLTIPQMTSQNAGLYTCSYQIGHIWSPPSEPLTLVMIGDYNSPSLYAVPSPMLIPGQMTLLVCVSNVKFEMFMLTHDNGVHTSLPARFTTIVTIGVVSIKVGLVTPTQVGSLRCFGYFQNSSYVWSHPSDPLWLQIIDTPFTALSTQPALPTGAYLPTEFPSIFTVTGQAGGGEGVTGGGEVTGGGGTAGGEGSAVGFPVETAVRLALAALVLLVMLAMLVEAWISRKIPILVPH